MNRHVLAVLFAFEAILRRTSSWVLLSLSFSGEFFENFVVSPPIPDYFENSRGFFRGFRFLIAELFDLANRRSLLIGRGGLGA